MRSPHFAGRVKRKPDPRGHAGIGLRKVGANLGLTAGSRHYAELAKTWLTIAGDLADLESQLKADPEKKAG